MMMSRSYRIAFGAAIFLHLMIVAYFSFEKTNPRPVLTVESRNEAGQSQPQPTEQTQPIQAVSVDSKEIMSAVSELKQERIRHEQAEASRQRALKQQAEQAQKQRLEAQQQLAKLKSEAEALAVARQKHIAEEKEHLKQLALQKQEQEKQIADMKKQQEQLKKQQELEAKKLAELAKKKTVELAKANQEQAKKAEKDKLELAKEAQEKAEKARAAWIQKQQAAAALAATEAANAAKVAGEVDKYKALILNAISQQWILPQNVDSSMSSQFRIRLAPNGAVLEVALIRSSGDPILDRSAQSAIYKASPLPVPNDPTTFNLFRDISLTVRPINGRG